MSVGYIYDNHLGQSWHDEQGVQVGIGSENKRIDSTSLTLAYRYFGSYSKSKYEGRLDDIEFDLPSEHINNMGYAELDFNKSRFGIEFDLGYQDWEDTHFEPYVSFGFQNENYISKLKYALYEEDTCHCVSSTSEIISQAMTLGYNTGVGFKIRATEYFSIDFRSTYYGGWRFRKNKNGLMPNSETFHIENNGNATFDYSDNKYFHGFSFRVGIIFRLHLDADALCSYSWGSSDSDDDDDDDDDSDDYNSSSGSESSSGSGSSGTKPCTPTTLKPAATRGGGREKLKH